MLAVILPASVGMLILAKPAVALLLGHGATRLADANDTGSALALFALGLPGFCTFLYVVRVLQSMQRTRVAFWLYLVENGINVALALALVGPDGRAGPGALALGRLHGRRRLSAWRCCGAGSGTSGTPGAWSPLAARRDRHRGDGRGGAGRLQPVGGRAGVRLLVRMVASVVVGAVVYVGTSALLGTWADRLRPRRRDRRRVGDRRRVAGTDRGPSPRAAARRPGTVRRVAGTGPTPTGAGSARGTLPFPTAGGVESGGMGPGDGHGAHGRGP